MRGVQHEKTLPPDRSGSFVTGEVQMGRATRYTDVRGQVESGSIKKGIQV
jgi:hypothetical protein